MCRKYRPLHVWIWMGDKVFSRATAFNGDLSVSVSLSLGVFFGEYVLDIVLELHFYNVILYSYFMVTRGTVKFNNCPEIVEKIWETVARGRRPSATVSEIFSITEGQWFDCSPSSLEITVLLPNCFKSPKHCQQYADTRRWRREIWRYVTSFVTWPVNSAPLTGQ